MEGNKLVAPVITLIQDVVVKLPILNFSSPKRSCRKSCSSCQKTNIELRLPFAERIIRLLDLGKFLGGQGADIGIQC